MKRSGNPFVWFAVFVVVLEIGAGWILPYREHPHASQVSRNPTPLRAWPEYVRGLRSPTQSKHVAIVSNSQGVARDIADPEKLYVAVLEKAFSSAGLPVEVENWSVGGLQSDQIELLSMQAVRRDIDLIVLVLGPGSMDLRRRYRLGAHAADLDLLAGDPALWGLLPGAAFFPDTDYDDVLERTFLLLSKLGRSRVTVLDIVATQLDRKHHRLVFGSPRPRGALHSLEQQDRSLAKSEPPQSRRPERLSRYRGASGETWRQQFIRSRLPTFKAIYPGLQQRLADNNIPLIWIWLPMVHSGGYAAVIKEGARPFFDEVCRDVRQSGSRCLDLSDALPDKAFLSHGISSHLNEHGHALMAQTLFPIVRDALH